MMNRKIKKKKDNNNSFKIKNIKICNFSKTSKIKSIRKKIEK